MDLVNDALESDVLAAELRMKFMYRADKIRDRLEMYPEWNSMESKDQDLAVIDHFLKELGPK